MADMMAAGSAWLAAKLSAHAAGNVTYTRGDEPRWYTMAVARGRTEYEKADDYGLVTAAETADFLVATALFPAALDEPQSGDHIIAGDATYEVLDFPGLGAWRWTDAQRTMLRIHTREIGSE